MKYKFIQIGYLLGISLFLASIFYFFASNWQGFDRITKVLLSIMIMVMFYGLSFLLTRILQHHPFLNKWMFVAGSISFGLSVALIGQLYNSHADSYQLFLVWLIPILLFSKVTKYEPMYVLAYVLFHITLYLYINPTNYFIYWSETERFFIFLGIAIFNAILYFYSYHIIHSVFVKYASFTVFHFLMIYLTISEVFPTYSFWMKIIYLAILIYGFLHYYKTRTNKTLLVLYSIVGTIFVIIQGFELVDKYYGELFFVFLLGMVVLLLVGSIQLLKVIKSHPSNNIVKTVIVVGITLISTIFATTAIVGLLSIVFNGITTVGAFIIGIILGLVGFISKRQVTIRYTLLSTGYVIAAGASIFGDNQVLMIILLCILAISLFKLDAKGMKIFHYFLLNLIAFTLLREWTSIDAEVYFLLFIGNGVYYTFQKNEKVSRKSAFLYALGALLGLTMINELSFTLNLLYDIFFFVFATFSIFWSKKKGKSFEFYASLIFWFLFIGEKYYDLAWELVHKSILFLILGVIFIATSHFFEEKNFILKEERSFVREKWIPIIFVILLQFGFVGYQAISNETLLNHGTTIDLQLRPVDPRSLLQGDYVNLSYDISVIPNLEQTNNPRGLIKVVLRKSNHGVYEFSGFYQFRGTWNKTYVKKPGDVVINGHLNGIQVVMYGIENYFVSEGTGANIQNQVHFARVKVGKNGNAILEKIY